MNIWFMVWVFIAVFIIGTSLWSLVILLRQKRAWEDLSKKCGLEYVSVAFLKSAGLRGVFNQMPVVIFSDRPISGKKSELGSRSIIQITLKSPMATEGVIASGAFRNFVNGLSLPEKFDPEFDGWNKEICISLQNLEAIKSYFTKERLAALNALMSIKNSPAMLIFSATETVIRIESSDPFDDAERLERFLVKSTDAAKIISI